MLVEEFLVPHKLSQVELAERIGVPFQRINLLVNGKRAISTDTALRLAKLFGTSAEYWLNMQLAWDLWHAQRAPDAKRISRIKRLSRLRA